MKFGNFWINFKQIIKYGGTQIIKLWKNLKRLKKENKRNKKKIKNVIKMKNKKKVYGKNGLEKLGMIINNFKNFIKNNFF